MKIESMLTDEAVLAELGRRFAERRIARELTQAELADAAGVGKRTVERLESGGSVQLVTLVRICRVLNLMDGLEGLLPPALAGPMALLRDQARARKRRRVRHAASAADDGDEPWRWGEDR